MSARAALIALLVIIAGVGTGLAATRWRDGGSADAAPVPAAVAPHGARRMLSGDEARRAAVAGLLPPGTRSILDVRTPLTYGDFAWDDGGVRAGPVLVRVDLRTQMLSVYRGGDEIGTAVALYGMDGHATPTGTFPILAKERLHRSIHYDADMPFSLWLTRDGVAIHASDVRWGRATHGCVGLPPAFAQRLFAAVRVGDRVVIVGSAAPDASAAPAGAASIGAASTGA